MIYLINSVKCLLIEQIIRTYDINEIDEIDENEPREPRAIYCS
jgi:hypothetical protein